MTWQSHRYQCDQNQQDPLKIEFKFHTHSAREREGKNLADLLPTILLYEALTFEIRRDIRLGQWVIDHSTGLSYVPPNKNGHLFHFNQPIQLD